MRIIVSGVSETGKKAVLKAYTDTRRADKIFMRAQKIKQEYKDEQLVITLPDSFKMLGARTWEDLTRDVLEQNGANHNDYQLNIEGL